MTKQLEIKGELSNSLHYILSCASLFLCWILFYDSHSYVPRALNMRSELLKVATGLEEDV